MWLGLDVVLVLGSSRPRLVQWHRHVWLEQTTHKMTKLVAPLPHFGLKSSREYRI